MRPINLKVSGLNSFIEEVDIDFSQLIERGLFGIFGPTGSGKSSILDAMTLALFGKISRDTKEFINKESDQVYVSFTFSIGEREKSYQVERRLKKRDEGYLTSFCRLQIKEEANEKVQVFDKVGEVNTQLETIIGLNYDDFSRSVVLPQGKFSRFLQLKNKPKRDMLERILGLSEFGAKLQDRVTEEKNQRNSELQGVLTNLTQYQKIEREHLQEEKRAIQKMRESKEIFQKDLKETAAHREEYYGVYENQKKLEEYRGAMDRLLEKREEMEEKVREQALMEKALGLKERIRTYDETKEELHHILEKSKGLAEELEEKRRLYQEVEKEYSQALNEKEEELPRIITKKIEIERARDLLEEKRELEKKIKKREEREKELLLHLNDLNREREDLSKTLDSLTETIKTLEERGEDLQVTSKLRDGINRGSQKTKAFKDVEKTIKKKKKSLSTLKKNQDIQKKKEKQAEESMKGSKERLSGLKEQLEDLESRRPKSEEELQDKEELVKTREKSLKDHQETQEKIKRKREEHAKRAEEEIKLTDHLKTLHREHQEKEKSFTSLEEEIEETKIKNMAGILAKELKEEEPCPVCGSLEHPTLAKRVEASLSEREEKLEEIKLLLKKIDSKKNEKKTQLLLLESGQERLKEELEELEKLLLEEEYRDLLKEVEELKRFIEEERSKRSTWKREWEESKEQLSIVEREIKEREEEILTTRTRQRERQIQIEETNEELEELAKERESLLTALTSLKEDLSIPCFEEAIEVLKHKDETLESLQTTLKKKREEKEEAFILHQEKERLFQEKEKERDNSIQARTMEEETYNTKKREIEDLVGRKSPKEYLEEMKRREEKIRKRANDLEEKRDKTQKFITRKKETLTGLKESEETLKEKIKEQEKYLLEAIDQLSLDSLEDTRSLIKREKGLSTLRKEIETYERERDDLKATIEHIERELQGRSITQKEWEELCEKKETLEREINSLLTELAKREEKLERLAADLTHKEELLKRKKELDHQLSLIHSIYELVKANKFVEYVAIQKLHYIAREASKRLLQITSDRYGLELDSSGEFVICDHYNGGVRRDCNTLSGGETFLASLSLALALSSRIQLKGETHMEFFFLDEGFGTLDSGLLEVVMNSLEDLHHEHLSVGIISHVEELKNRVPVKLMVRSARPGICGSSVEIALS